MRKPGIKPRHKLLRGLKYNLLRFFFFLNNTLILKGVYMKFLEKFYKMCEEFWYLTKFRVAKVTPVAWALIHCHQVQYSLHFLPCICILFHSRGAELRFTNFSELSAGQQLCILISYLRKSNQILLLQNTGKLLRNIIRIQGIRKFPFQGLCRVPKGFL